MSDRFGRDAVSFSRLYNTAAVGGPIGQEDFHNAVAVIHSNETAYGVWQFLHKTEQALGRHRQKRWEARRIDLDVLLHETALVTPSHYSKEIHSQEIVWTPTFKVPHPRMTMRTFVLSPACDIAGDWVEPVTGQSLHKLSARLDRLASNKRLPTILLTCDSNDTVQSLMNSLRRSEHDLYIEDEQQPRVIRQDQLWILVCMVPRIQSSGATSDHYHAVSQAIGVRIAPYQNSLSSAGFDQWMHVCRSPDPSISHWEDFSRPWADSFGMTNRQEGQLLLRTFGDLAPLRNTPPYLLAADDFDWAAHELFAATEAMTCPIQPCGTI